MSLMHCENMKIIYPLLSVSLCAEWATFNFAEWITFLLCRVDHI